MSLWQYMECMARAFEKSHGCQRCANKQRNKENTKSHQWYLDKLNKVEATVIPLENYRKKKVPILHRCIICTNEWKTTPDFVLAKKRLARSFGCPICSTRYYASIAEKEIVNFLIDCGLAVQTQKPFDGGKSVADIIIPTHKIVIEYNGLYWHSTLNRKPDIHWYKTKLHHRFGYRTIHIWEDEWRDERRRIKQWLKFLLELSIRQPKNFGRNQWTGNYDLCWVPIQSNISYIPSQEYIFSRSKKLQFADGTSIKRNTRVPIRSDIISDITDILHIFDCGSYK